MASTSASDAASVVMSKSGDDWLGTRRLNLGLCLRLRLPFFRFAPALVHAPALPYAPFTDTFNSLRRFIWSARYWARLTDFIRLY